MGLADPGAAARNSIKVQGATLVILRHCDDRVKDSARQSASKSHGSARDGLTKAFEFAPARTRWTKRAANSDKVFPRTSASLRSSIA